MLTKQGLSPCASNKPEGIALLVICIQLILPWITFLYCKCVQFCSHDFEAPVNSITDVFVHCLKLLNCREWCNTIVVSWVLADLIQTNNGGHRYAVCTCVALMWTPVHLNVCTPAQHQRFVTIIHYQSLRKSAHSHIMQHRSAII